MDVETHDTANSAWCDQFMRKLCPFFAYHTHMNFQPSLTQLSLPTSLFFQQAVNHAVNENNKKHKHNKKAEQEESLKAMTAITLRNATEKEVLRQKRLDLKEEEKEMKKVLKEKKLNQFNHHFQFHLLSQVFLRN